MVFWRFLQQISIKDNSIDWRKNTIQFLLVYSKLNSVQLLLLYFLSICIESLLKMVQCFFFFLAIVEQM